MVVPLGPTQTHTSAYVMRRKHAKLIGPTSIVNPREWGGGLTRLNRMVVECTRLIVKTKS